MIPLSKSIMIFHATVKVTIQHFGGKTCTCTDTHKLMHTETHSWDLVLSLQRFGWRALLVGVEH